MTGRSDRKPYAKPALTPIDASLFVGISQVTALCSPCRSLFVEGVSFVLIWRQAGNMTDRRRVRWRNNVVMKNREKKIERTARRNRIRFSEGRLVVEKKRATKTNISEQRKEAFNALVSGRYDNFALFSCFVNGEPSAAIVTVGTNESGDVNIEPLFVAVTPEMRLEDHDGREPELPGRGER